MRTLTSAWKHTPALLAAGLLAFQISIPWRVPHFTTQDGPSHLYGSTIFRELIAQRKTSIYSRLYTIQRKVIPNWTATVLLAATSSIAGVDYAERLFASLAMLAGFLGWAYLNRGASPVANAMLQVWFLWLGFYNFYLGMMLLPFLLGFYARRAGRLSWRAAGALSVGMIALLLTHLVPATIAAVALALIAMAAANRRELVMVALTLLPTAILAAVYVATGHAVLSDLHAEAGRAWREFPSFFFLTGGGPYGEQRLLTKFLLGYICVAPLLLRKKEWRSPTGGLAAAAVVTFFLYLFLPDRSLDGSMIKIRFAWAVFFLGAMVAWQCSRLRYFRIPVALVLTWLVGANLVATQASARRLSNAAEDYLAATRSIPTGATFIRLKYPAPGAPAHFGYAGLGVDPLFHLDGYVAAQRRALNLSDYEPIAKIFPVVYKKTIDPGFQATLWAMEGPRDWTVGVLKWLDENFPARFGYLIVVGELGSPEAGGEMGMPQMIEHLNASMDLCGVSPSGFVRVYKKRK